MERIDRGGWLTIPGECDILLTLSSVIYGFAEYDIKVLPSFVCIYQYCLLAYLYLLELIIMSDKSSSIA